MAIKYQVDGDVFREITEKWPFAYVNERLIQARGYSIDWTGNQIESFQLDDGRMFERVISRRGVRAATDEPTTIPVFAQTASQPA